MCIYIIIYIQIYIYKRVDICRTAYRVLNSKLERSRCVQQINSIFDLSFYYYLVSHNTTGVLHSSDKMTECEFTLAGNLPCNKSSQFLLPVTKSCTNT